MRIKIHPRHCIPPNDQRKLLQPIFNYAHRPTSTSTRGFNSDPRPYHTLRELELYRITRSKEFNKWYNKPDRDRRSVQIKARENTGTRYITEQCGLEPSLFIIPSCQPSTSQSRMRISSKDHIYHPVHYYTYSSTAELNMNNAMPMNLV